MKHRLLALTLLMALPGCLLLPHYQTLGGKFSGRVVDPKGQPVSGVTVEYLYNSHRLLGTTKTDPTGQFKLGPFRQWFYLVYIGSPGVCPFPYSIDSLAVYPNALRLRQKESAALYMIGTRDQHVVSLLPTMRDEFVVPSSIRWTGTDAKPSLILSPGMKADFTPKRQFSLRPRPVFPIQP